jgi:hypothetical protein
VNNDAEISVAAGPKGLVFFGWHSYDVRAALPSGWREDLMAIARSCAEETILIPSSVTSRERSDVTGVPVLTVGGVVLAEAAPWLLQLYRDLFRNLGQQVVDEELVTAADLNITINLNIQTGTAMRYEAHVDSNPLQGMLYVTNHPPGDGGELVIAQRVDAVGTEEIDDRAALIYPVGGQLVFFDGRRHPHYVRPLRSKDATRLAVAMNFYTPSSPEAARPRDLNRHLFGDD